MTNSDYINFRYDTNNGMKYYPNLDISTIDLNNDLRPWKVTTSFICNDTSSFDSKYNSAVNNNLIIQSLESDIRFITKNNCKTIFENDTTFNTNLNANFIDVSNINLNNTLVINKDISNHIIGNLGISGNLNVEGNINFNTTSDGITNTNINNCIISNCKIGYNKDNILDVSVAAFSDVSLNNLSLNTINLKNKDTNITLDLSTVNYLNIDISYISGLIDFSINNINNNNNNNPSFLLNNNTYIINYDKQKINIELTGNQYNNNFLNIKQYNDYDELTVNGNFGIIDLSLSIINEDISFIFYNLFIYKYNIDLLEKLQNIDISINDITINNILNKLTVNDLSINNSLTINNSQSQPKIKIENNKIKFF